MRWINFCLLLALCKLPVPPQELILILVAVALTAVQGQREEVPGQEDIPVVEIQGIPDEPPVEGGFPPAAPETQIEPLSSEIPKSDPTGEFPDDEDCIVSS